MIRLRPTADAQPHRQALIARRDENQRSATTSEGVTGAPAPPTGLSYRPAGWPSSISLAMRDLKLAVRRCSRPRPSSCVTSSCSLQHQVIFQPDTTQCSCAQTAYQLDALSLAACQKVGQGASIRIWTQDSMHAFVFSWYCLFANVPTKPKRISRTPADLGTLPLVPDTYAET